MARRRRLLTRDEAETTEPPTEPLDPLSLLVAQAAALQRGVSSGGMSPWELPIVVNCRALIANTIAQLPLIAVRNNQARPDQPRIVVQPNPSEPRWKTFYRIVNNLTGNGHVWLVPTAWDAAGWPLAAKVVDAANGSAQFDGAGELVAVQMGDRTLEVGPDGVVPIQWDISYASDPGRSPIAPCWRAAEYLAALYDMAGSFWEAGFPSYAVNVPMRLSPSQITEMKAKLLARTARRHEPVIIDNKATLAPLGASAVESQLVESIATANVEIARAFGVLPSMVNVESGGSLTYSTTVDEFRKWIITGLQAYMIRIEAAFDQLLPYGTTTRFDTDELLRADPTTRASFYSSGLTDGWLTVAEVREREGLPPLTGTVPTSSPPALAGDPTASGGAMP